MKSFNVITGLPRAGSTLLANILSQNPDIYVSGTSTLSAVVANVSHIISTTPETSAELANVPRTYDRYTEAMQGLIKGWYSHRKEPIIFDKGRGWSGHNLLLKQLFPDAVLLVCVRDPRDVTASIEKQHRKTALFTSPTGTTVFERTENMMSADGMVGVTIRGVEDLLRRNVPGVYFVKYESFMKNPETTMKEIYGLLGREPYEHDFKHVENKATDLDALYMNKFPHKGDGSVTGQHIGTWRDFLDADLANKVANVYPYYMDAFGYTRV